MRWSSLAIVLSATVVSTTTVPAQTLPSSGAMADSSLRIKKLTQATTVAADGRSQTTTSSEIQVLSAAGVAAAAQMPIIYNATIQDATVVEAHTVKLDGRKIPVNSTSILTQSAPNNRSNPIYSDIEEKIILFPNVEPGDTLVFSANVTDKVAMIPGEFSIAHFLATRVEADQTSYSVTAPKTLSLTVSSHDVKQEISDSAESVTYRWAYSNPSPKPSAPRLVFEPDAEPYFSASTFPTYDSMAHNLSTRILSKIEVTPAIQNQADLITAGISDQREQGRLIYNWVNQHIRYVAIELGVGGIVPHEADWTFTNAFGDCKDQAVLFAALLKAKNIPSELALINSTNRYKLGRVPTLSEFNHMIVWLPQWRLYADTTASDVEFGSLPMVDYGKPVVHLVLAGLSQHTTPLIAPGLLNSTFKVHATMNSQRQFTVEASTSATGPWNDILHKLGRQIEERGPAPAAADLLKLHGFANAIGMLNASTTQPGGEYSLHGTFRTGKMVAGGNVFSVATGMRILDRSGDGPLGPLDNLRLSGSDETPCYSAHQTEDIVMDFPAGEHLARVPQDVHVKGHILSYDTHWRTDSSTVSVHREFSSIIGQPICAGPDRVEAAAAFEKIRADYAASTALAVP